MNDVNAPNYCAQCGGPSVGRYCSSDCWEHDGDDEAKDAA